MSLAAACVALALVQSNPAIRAQVVPETAISGSSVTRLADGRELVVGGAIQGRAQRGAWLRDATTGELLLVPLPNVARAWHSATLLPDGTVLILGGDGATGRPVIQAERFNPETNAFEVLPALSWRARAAHSATLVDGQRLVVAGGLVDGAPVGDIEIVDIAQWQAAPIDGLSVPRARHTATLLADGRIVLWGGQGADPNVETSGTVVDLAGGRLTDIFVPEQGEQFLYVAASDPADSTIVEAPHTISLRLSKPARLETLNAETVTLAGPSGNVGLKIVPAEQGRLIFLTPTTALEPNTTYLVTINGARDSANTQASLLSVTFSTTDGARPPPDQPSDDEVWDPRTDNANGTWRKRTVESEWQQLPPLSARPGVTALSGQVLLLNGSPLAGVRLEIEGRDATTDATGRFLIIADGTTTGWHELWIDGRPAKRGRSTYGTFEAAVWMTAAQTTSLPFTIWMPAIDTANAVKIASPTTSETVVTTPLIPGLELRLPPGAVITDEDGKVVREVSITAIPVDQPPFPLPAGVDVPIYFTIQPGGAYVTVAGNGRYRTGARLIYPNYRRRPAGAQMEFWHYEPEGGRGWYVYGLGAVSADGRQVVPNPGISIYEFTGAMVAPPSFGPGQKPAPGDPGYCCDPVHLGTGLFVLTKTDLNLAGVMPIGITRTYRQNDSRSRAFGIGATHPYDIFLVGDTFPYTYADLILPDGGQVHYTRISPGTGWEDAVYEHTSSPTAFFKSRISWNGNGWNLDLKDGSRITLREGFAASRPQQAAATSVRDRHGNTIVLTRDSSANLTRITSPNGRWIELTYDGSYRVTQAKDNIGRTVGYTYDGSGRLWKVTDPAGGVTEYTYDSSHRMLTLKDARGIVFLTNQYDGNGRVSQQTQADSTTYQFAYTLDGMGRITQTDVTNPRSHVRRVAYNAASGYLTSDTEALGTAVARTTTFTRNSNNLVTRVTDGLSRNTDYAYDTAGNVTSVTRLAGTGSAVTTSYTYEATFNLLTSITDPLNHTTTFTRDSTGNVTAITDPLSHQTTLTYNAAGQPATVTTPAGTTQFSYAGGDLVGVTDPLGRTRTQYIDAAGRLVRTTNPLGQSTTHEYDPLNAVTKTIDALSGQTTFTYDANRNLLTLTDALNHTTTYTYNNMDRVVTRADPLTRGESYVYDANGNLQQMTDRKNQVTAYTYDALNRLSTVTYHDTSTTTHTYDAGDRLTQVVDSAAGTITRTWDLLDRLTQEVTPEGTVSYTYDAADRRATMTVAGQPQVSYGYDNADRLTSITQNSATVGFTYDSADRRTVLTLPNGVTVEYGYDVASQVTGLTYKLAAATLGNLTYTYDQAGNRTSVGGSWARTDLPAALASATYDAANQIATWDATSFTYDANGNLTNDGAKTYTWNARNQLTGLAGGVSASFQYDGLGRRRAKTISGASSGFLYDGLNMVQELVSGSPSANILPGLGIDEWLTRTDASGTRHFLSDALNSTVALTDGGGAVQTEYSYQPFGQSTGSGASSTNSFQFTGRENDGTGLSYYRARYYSSAVQRFIAEDPLGFEAGDANLHAYVFNAPLDFTDPLGEIVKPVRLPFYCDPDSPARKIPLIPLLDLLFGICDPTQIPMPAPLGMAPTPKFPSKVPPGLRRAPKEPRWKPTDALRQHNKQARDAAKAAGLNREQTRRLHDEITGENFTYQEIVEIAKGIKGGSGK
jgi:RHS repeat-associated protein